jgi:hypothetical protein
VYLTIRCSERSKRLDILLCTPIVPELEVSARVKYNIVRESIERDYSTSEYKYTIYIYV